MSNNSDQKTVNGFGDEWERFDQSQLAQDEQQVLFDKYFSIFPWSKLPEGSTGFDMGCGSGRWATFMYDKVGLLNCVDPSKKALNVAKKNLQAASNINFIEASVGDNNILQEGSQDFGYCLGVLHHVPETAEGIKSCSKLLKKGAPFLIYLYYNFEKIFYVLTEAR